MKLLQLPVSALEERIQAELEANPALEEGVPEEGVIDPGAMVELGDGWYVGVPVQIEKWKHVEIVRPLPPPPEPVVEDVVEIPAEKN